MNSDTINSYIITKKGVDKEFDRSDLIKYFVSSFNKDIRSDSPKNIILNLPYLNTARKWFLFDIVLSHMQKSFKSTPIRFKKGDCLLIIGTKRKIVCEFVEYENEDTEDEMIRVRFDDSLEIASQAGYWAYEKIERQKLSTFKSFRLNKKLFSIDKIIDKSSNNNFAMFDTSFIYVGAINSIKKFISTNSVFDNPIQKTIEWSKANEDGKIKKIYGNETGHFNCIVAPTVASAATTIFKNTNENFDAIIIDNLDICQNYLSDIAELVELNVPIFILSQDIDRENYDIFCKNLNFDLWHWGMSPIKALSEKINIRNKKHTYDIENLHIAFDNFSNKRIDIYVTINKEIEKIGIYSLKMMNELSEEPFSNKIYSKLRLLALRLSRMSSVSCIDSSVLATHFDDIERSIDKNEFLVPESDKLIFRDMLAYFKDFLLCNSDQDIDKKDKLFEIIEKNKEKSIAVLTSLNQGNSKLQKLIKHSTLKDIDIYSSSEKITVQDNYDIGIVTGWPVGKKLNQILSANKFKQIIFLVYPYQLQWLKRKIENKNTLYSRSHVNKSLDILYDEDDAIKLLMKDTNVLPEPSIIVPEKIDINPSINIDIEEFEVQIKQRRRKAFQSSEEDGLIRFERAKLIDFYDGFAGVFSESHKFLNVSSMVDNHDNSSIVESKIKNLRSGDYILHFETEKGSVKEVTYKKMEDDDMLSVHTFASLWVKILQSLYKKYDYDTYTMYQSLKDEGLSVGIAQLRNWINEETIAPKNTNNFLVIGNVEGGDLGKVLIDKSKKILEACDIVKQYRLQVASSLRKAAFKVISDQDLTIYRDLGQNVIRLDIEEFGEATIYRIEDIDTDFMEYPHSEINKIKEEEL